MNNLTLEEVRTGLLDLVLGSRRAKLDLLPVAISYLPDLNRLLQGITDLAPELLGMPKAQLLALADGRRDTYLRLLRQLGELIAACPTCSEETRNLASRMLDTFVYNQSVNDPYAVAAAKAETLQQPRDAMRPELTTIPTPDGRTAAAWVDDFVDGGLETGRTLSNRAEELTQYSGRHAAGALRGEAIGTLNELRAVVQRAVRNDSSLPQTLEGDLFGLFDEMQRLAASRAKTPAIKPVAPDLATGTSGTLPEGSGASE